MKETHNKPKNVELAELIIQHLLEGKTQIQISNILKEQGIEPNSLSQIEKSLKKLKEKHRAKTLFHLGAILMLKRHIKRSN